MVPNTGKAIQNKFHFANFQYDLNYIFVISIPIFISISYCINMFKTIFIILLTDHTVLTLLLACEIYLVMFKKI